MGTRLSVSTLPLVFIFFSLFSVGTKLFAGDECRDRCESIYNRCVGECSINDPDCVNRCDYRYTRCIDECGPEAPVLSPGDVVETIAASPLYVGTEVVGHVDAGQRFLLGSILNEWASLQQLDGTAIRGWLLLSNLKAAPAH